MSEFHVNESESDLLDRAVVMYVDALTRDLEASGVGRNETLEDVKERTPAGYDIIDFTEERQNLRDFIRRNEFLGANTGDVQVKDAEVDAVKTAVKWLMDAVEGDAHVLSRTGRKNLDVLEVLDDVLQKLESL